MDTEKRARLVLGLGLSCFALMRFGLANGEVAGLTRRASSRCGAISRFPTRVDAA